MTMLNDEFHGHGGSYEVRDGNLDAEITRIQDQNAQIGLTKAQVDALKASEIDRSIQRLQADQAIALSDGNTSEAAQHYSDLLDAQIAKLKTIQGLMNSGAQLQATADATKKQTEEWNKLWTSVESVGKQAFVHIFSDGKNAFQAIGQALKASVIDVL